MRTRWPTSAFRVLIPIVVTLCSCGPRDTLPPLLRNLTAKGGYASACPVPPNLKASGAPLELADSPELDRRLQMEFPSGTPEHELIAKLRQMGFGTMSRCDDDQAIRMARYDQAAQPDVFLFFPMTATVYWKVDKNTNVVWSKGFVSFTGP